MAANTSQIGFIAAASTNITAAAYVQIKFGAIADSFYPNTPISTSKIQITDTTGKIIKIAYMLPGQAVSTQIDAYTNSPNGSIVISKYFPPGTSLWAEAIDSSNAASTGYVAVSLVP